MVDSEVVTEVVVVSAVDAVVATLHPWDLPNKSSRSLRFHTIVRVKLSLCARIRAFLYWRVQSTLRTKS